MAKGRAMKVKRVDPKGLTVQNKKIPVVVIIFAAILVVGLVVLGIGVSQSEFSLTPKINTTSAPADTTADDDTDDTDDADDEAEAEDNSGGITELATKDTKKGKGKAAKTGDTVEVIYTGKLYVDGTVFDATEKHPEDKYPKGKPLAVELGSGSVIPGFDQGLVGMKVGGKRTVTIPPDLAYGSPGTDGIPPNSSLVFELELVSLKAKAK